MSNLMNFNSFLQSSLGQAGSAGRAGTAGNVGNAGNAFGRSSTFQGHGFGHGGFGGHFGMFQVMQFMMMALFSMMQGMPQHPPAPQQPQAPHNPQDPYCQNPDPYTPPPPPPPAEYPPVDYPPPPPPPPVEYPPVEYPPPPPPETKVNGSAMVFGDPKMGLNTPSILSLLNSADQSALRDIDTGLAVNDTFYLMRDPDNDLQIQARTVGVNPADPANSVGIGYISLNPGTQQLNLLNNGDIQLDGNIIGNVTQAMSSVTLATGETISVEPQIDGPNGETALRFTFTGGEYEFTAALRSPHPDSKNYYDVNLEELVPDAADNATSTQFNFSSNGVSAQLGVSDLLALEEHSPLIQELRGMGMA